jgi:hypothetical protein
MNASEIQALLPATLTATIEPVEAVAIIVITGATTKHRMQLHFAGFAPRDIKATDGPWESGVIGRDGSGIERYTAALSRAKFRI